MTTQYLFTKRKWDGFLTLIVAIRIPNWFERHVLRKKEYQIRWVGHGKKWALLDKDVNKIPLDGWFDRFLIRRLEAIEGGVEVTYNTTRKKGHTINKGIKMILILMLCGSLASCQVAHKFADRQKELQAQHCARHNHQHPKPKKDPRKEKTALAVACVVFVIWISALEYYGSYDKANPNPTN